MKSKALFAYTARLRLLLAFVALALLVACDEAPPAKPAKISVYRDGGVIVSGFRVTPDSMHAALARAHAAHQKIWLYIEPGEGIGNAVAQDILDRLAKDHTEYQLFTSDDYTEYIGSDGKTHSIR